MPPQILTQILQEVLAKFDLVADWNAWEADFKLRTGAAPTKSDSDEYNRLKGLTIQAEIDRTVEEYKMKSAGTLGKVM